MEHEHAPPAGDPRTIEGDVGPEIYQELLADFLGHLSSYLTDLDAAAAVGDVLAARYVAHQIKGTALSFGAAGLDLLAERMLVVGKDDGALLRPLVADIENEIAHLQASLGDGSLETDLGSEEYQQLLADFLGHLPLQLVDLTAAATAGDVPAARYVAHQIKGCAPRLGLDILDGLADRLMKVEPDQNEILRRVVGEVEQEAARLQSELSVSTIESDLGPELYAELLVEFLGHFPAYLSGLHNAALMNDVPAARYVAHQIKGNALSFGAVRLDGLADRVLQIGRNQSDRLQLLVEEIDQEVVRLQATLGR